MNLRNGASIGGLQVKFALTLALAIAAVCTPDAPAAAKLRAKSTVTHKHTARISLRPARPLVRPMRLGAKTPALPIEIAAPLPPLAVSKTMSRAEIFASDRDRLERVGRHVIVGYHDFSSVKALVDNRAIAGIFITDHNVRGRSASDIKAAIAALQDIRKSQGLPPLVIAADQEGGQVSRLSPPLKRQQSLARLLAGLPDDVARRKAVETYAEMQAAELKRIGVTLNFGPVVDLNLTAGARDDGETHLRQRAIAADPYLVAKVGAWYCDTLAKSGIMCTLKHFPSLGRVLRDTHVASGEISVSEGNLELNDWVPFRTNMQRPNAATMLGHVRISAIDKATPASFSKFVIAGLIRERWNYDGLLITDDFSMGAITRVRGGAGAAAVQSINAGTDLILVSFVEKHYDEIVSALISADRDMSLAAAPRQASRERMSRILDTALWPQPN